MLVEPPTLQLRRLDSSSSSPLRLRLPLDPQRSVEKSAH